MVLARDGCGPLELTAIHLLAYLDPVSPFASIIPHYASPAQQEAQAQLDSNNFSSRAPEDELSDALLSFPTETPCLSITCSFFFYVWVGVLPAYVVCIPDVHEAQRYSYDHLMGPGN